MNFEITILYKIEKHDSCAEEEKVIECCGDNVNIVYANDKFKIFCNDEPIKLFDAYVENDNYVRHIPIKIISIVPRKVFNICGT